MIYGPSGGGHRTHAVFAFTRRSSALSASFHRILLHVQMSVFARLGFPILFLSSPDWAFLSPDTRTIAYLALWDSVDIKMMTMLFGGGGGGRPC
jgi:hypothetical protein